MIVAFSIATAGYCAAEDGGYSCPPGAKFCPAPGAGAGDVAATSDFGSFGLPAPEPAQMPQGQYDMHASQLYAGEQLVMVAPTAGGYGQIPQTQVTTPMPMASYDAPAGAAFDPFNNAGAPLYANSASADGGLDFIPPPPGVGRSTQMPAPAPTVAYAPQPSMTMPRAEPAYQAAPPAQRPAPAPIAKRAAPPRPAERDMASGPAARVAPRDNPMAPSPRSFAQTRTTAGFDDNEDYRPSQRQAEVKNDRPAPKRKKADMLSEVANETSSRKKIDDGKKSAEAKRVPWWKGGIWKNRKKG